MLILQLHRSSRSLALDVRLCHGSARSEALHSINTTLLQVLVDTPVVHVLYIDAAPQLHEFCTRMIVPYVIRFSL